MELSISRLSLNQQQINGELSRMGCSHPAGRGRMADRRRSRITQMRQFQRRRNTAPAAISLGSAGMPAAKAGCNPTHSSEPAFAERRASYQADEIRAPGPR
ncbi:MAG: hypothetical protein AB7H90_06755 [Alphaproteobacteria bacterium]